jgi:hypothetical protein
VTGEFELRAEDRSLTDNRRDHQKRTMTRPFAWSSSVGKGGVEPADLRFQVGSGRMRARAVEADAGPSCGTRLRVGGGGKKPGANEHDSTRWPGSQVNQVHLIGDDCTAAQHESQAYRTELSWPLR